MGARVIGRLAPTALLIFALNPVFAYDKDITTNRLRGIVEEALPAIVAIQDESQRGALLGWAAHLLAASGEGERAIQLAEDLQSPWERDLVLSRAAQSLAEFGSLEVAREVALRIQSAQARDFALMFVAARQEPSNHTEALKTLEAISDPRRRSEGLSLLGISEGLRGEWAAADSSFQQAIETVLAMDEGPEQAQALVRIAEQQANAGLRSAAIRTLDTARERLSALAEEDKGQNDYLWGELARVQALAGLTGEAQATMEKPEQETWRERAGQGIAKAQAEAGDWAGAESTIARLAERPEQADSARVQALQDLARAQTNEGDMTAALATTERMPEDHWLRAETLATIGRAQASRGDSGGARESFRRALETAHRVGDPRMQAQALRIVAVDRAYAGDIAGAREIAEGIEDANERAEAFSGTAGAQVRLGDVEGALRWARTLEPAGLRARALLSVGETLVALSQRSQ